MRTYEAMFLLNAGNSDFEAASAPVREVLARAEAEVLAIKPWDERKLAYKIKGQKRGLYVLTYFKADPARLDEMQHDIQLNENVLRAIVLSADHISAEQIQAETPATLAGARRSAAEAERKAKSPADSTGPAAGDSDDETPKEAPPDEAGPPESSSGQDAPPEDNTINADEPGEDTADQKPQT